MLIADDDPHDTFFLERALQKATLPLHPHFFHDGEQAMQYLRAEPPYTDHHPLPRICLLDIKMPRKNGFDVLKEVRSDDALKRLVVVMFSNSKLGRDIDLAYDLGANAYIVKPSKSDELVATLKRIYEFWFLTSRVSPTIAPESH